VKLSGSRQARSGKEIMFEAGADAFVFQIRVS